MGPGGKSNTFRSRPAPRRNNTNPGKVHSRQASLVCSDGFVKAFLSCRARSARGDKPEPLTQGLWGVWKKSKLNGSFKKK